VSSEGSVQSQNLATNCDPQSDTIIFGTPCKQHMSNIDLDILLSIVVGVEGYEVSGFGELIHDHPNRVKLVGSQR
jgi:hypothetical protein